MLTDLSLEFIQNGQQGYPLCWIIDEDALYDAALSYEHACIFLQSDDVVDISNEYPEHDGIVVRFLKNGSILEELKTSEYFGSILLSNPLVVNLFYHKYGIHVVSPRAKFINYKFYIPTLDLSSTYGWLTKYDPNDDSINAICTEMCKCGRSM